MADLSVHAGQNIQCGIAHLAEAIIAAIRNRLTHESAEIPMPVAMEMLGMMSLLGAKRRHLRDKPPPTVAKKADRQNRYDLPRPCSPPSSTPAFGSSLRQSSSQRVQLLGTIAKLSCSCFATRFAFFSDRSRGPI